MLRMGSHDFQSRKEALVMRKFMGLNIAPILLFCGVSLGMAGTLQKEFKKQFDFGSGGEMRVENVNGRIHVEAWEKEQVDVFAEIEVRAWDREAAEAFLDEVEIVVDERAGYLSFEVDYPRVRGSGSVWDAIFGRNRRPQVKVDFWIRVPGETDIDLSSVNGHIRVCEIDGFADLGTTNGSIEAEDMKGSVDAHTTNGGIRVELREFQSGEELSCRTTNGQIRLTLPHEVEADVTASTVNGRISTDFPMEIRGRYAGKNIRGQINEGGGLIELKTVNGSIHIYER